MILVHILTKEEKQAIEIAELLVSDRLILDAFITSGTKYWRNDKQITNEPQFMVYGKTKALLFDAIDMLLKKNYGQSIPTIY